VVAFFVSWGSSLHIDQTSKSSWLFPTSIHVRFAGLIFVLSLSNYESPRYLIKRGKAEHAVANMTRIRRLPPDNEYVLNEIGRNPEPASGRAGSNYGSRIPRHPTRDVSDAKQLLPHLPWPWQSASQPVARSSVHHPSMLLTSSPSSARRAKM